MRLTPRQTRFMNARPKRLRQMLMDAGSEDPVIKKWDVQQDDTERWVVPYQLDFISKKHKGKVKSALYMIEQETCIRFTEVDRTFGTDMPEDYLKFTDMGGCWSYVGRTGGRQIVSLGVGCKELGKAAHETMHALGFIHEHQSFGYQLFEIYYLK